MQENIDYEKFVQLYKKIKDLPQEQQKDEVRPYVGDIYRTFIKSTKDKTGDKREFVQAFYNTYGKLLVGDYSKQINCDIFSSCMLAYANEAKRNRVDSIYLNEFLKNKYMSEFVIVNLKNVDKYLSGNLSIDEKVFVKNTYLLNDILILYDNLNPDLKDKMLTLSSKFKEQGKDEISGKINSKLLESIYINCEKSKLDDVDITVIKKCLIDYSKGEKIAKDNIKDFLKIVDIKEKYDIKDVDILNYIDKIKSKEKLSVLNNSNIYQLDNIVSTKIIEGRLPKEVTDYYLKEMLNEDSDISKEKGKYELEREIVLKEAVLNVIGRDNIFEIVDVHGFDNDLTLGEVGVFHEKKQFVYISKNFLEKNSKLDLKCFETIFHEFTHKKQDSNLRKGNVNEIEYMIAKERLITQKYPRYYDQNYTLMFSEIDARLNAAKQYKSFVDGIGVDVIGENDYRQITENCDKTVNIEQANFDRAFKEKTLNGHAVDVNSLAEEILMEKVKENPNFIKENPVFSREYNIDGTKKTKVLSDAIRQGTELLGLSDINNQSKIIRAKVNEKDVEIEKFDK